MALMQIRKSFILYFFLINAKIKNIILKTDIIIPKIFIKEFESTIIFPLKKENTRPFSFESVLI